MPQIITSGSINLVALQAPDLYVQILQPPSFIRGVPTDVVGLVGTASWGPVNLPVLMGNGTDAVLNFGPMSATSLLDPYDIATDLFLAFGQSLGGGATLQGFGVRVTDGTDTAASVSLAGAATATPTQAAVSGTVTAGDVITLTATSSALAGSPINLPYTVRAADTLATIATGIAAAVNNNPVLNAAAVYAIASGTNCTIYWPTSLSPTIVWTRNVSGAATEVITLSPGSTSTAGGTLSALYTGSLGSQIKVTLATSVAIIGALNVTVSGFQGTAEVFPNIPTTNFWRNLQSALASGVSNYRGPSSWVRLTSVNGAVAAPVIGTYALSGGTDGRSGVTTSTLVGNANSTPRTGLWAMANVTPAVGIAWITGLTDPVAAASVDNFALTAGCSVLFPFPTGTSTATAVAAVQIDGIGGPEFAYVKDSVYFLDTINNLRRLVLPTAVHGGFWATIPPEQSPLNKQVQLVVGTERTDPVNGTVPYSPAEIGQLNMAGVMFITNPIPGGSVYGIRTAASTSPVDSTRPVEYWRLTMYIARSIDANMGLFVGMLQSQQPDDDLRNQVRLMLNAFGATLANAGQIDSGTGYCEFSNAAGAKFGNGVNTPASVAQHYLYALFQAIYLSSVWYFIVSVQGGTTVVQVVQAQ